MTLGLDLVGGQPQPTTASHGWLAPLSARLPPAGGVLRSLDCFARARLGLSRQSPTKKRRLNLNSRTLRLLWFIMHGSCPPFGGIYLLYPTVTGMITGIFVREPRFVFFPLLYELTCM